MSAGTGPDPIRVLVVDDQELVRSGFCVILEAAGGIRSSARPATESRPSPRRPRRPPTWC